MTNPTSKQPKDQQLAGINFKFEEGYLVISASVGGGYEGAFMKLVGDKDGEPYLHETKQRAWVDPEVWTVKIKLTPPDGVKK